MLEILLTPSYFLLLPSTYPPSTREGRFWNPRSGQREVRPSWPENFPATREESSSLSRNALPLARLLVQPWAAGFRAQESSQANARALEWAAFLTAAFGEAPRKKPRPRALHQAPGWLCSLWPWTARASCCSYKPQTGVWPPLPLGSARGPDGKTKGPCRGVGGRRVRVGGG